MYVFQNFMYLCVSYANRNSSEFFIEFSQNTMPYRIYCFFKYVGSFLNNTIQILQVNEMQFHRIFLLIFRRTLPFLDCYSQCHIKYRLRSRTYLCTHKILPRDIGTVYFIGESFCKKMTCTFLKIFVRQLLKLGR